MSGGVRVWCLRHAESENVTTGTSGVLPTAPLTPLPHARPFLVEWDGQAWHCPTWPAVA
jgi:hypothetical protein